MSRPFRSTRATRALLAVLDPALATEPAAATHDQRFVAHFVLGRCLAESYHTEPLIAQFRAATALEPDDVDAHMALLAELSVLVHQPVDSSRRVDHLTGDAARRADARWEREYLDQLAVARRRFTGDPDVAQILGHVFDEKVNTPAGGLGAAELAKRRRVGFAFFRWKRR